MKAGDGIKTGEGQWTFKDPLVVENFDSHVSKSVPFYSETQDLVLRLSDYFVSEDSVIVDVGCSTGLAMARLLERHAGIAGLKIVGVDNSQNMIDKAKQRVAGHDAIELFCQHIEEFEIPKSDMILVNYTAQFIKPRFRQNFFDHVYERLNWGGALFLFEKVRAPDARFQDMMTSAYHEFKEAQGYSVEEVVAKSKSLKGVLDPFSTDGNRGLLQRAGFVDILTIFKYVCFEGFLCIK